jgi:protein SCO1
MKLSSLTLTALFALFIFLYSCSEEKPLPVMGNAPIADFEFLNQDSTLINNDTFKDKVYIADFFFTSCTSICPTMHRAMKSIFDEYKNEPQLMFLSHTVDFKYDTPYRLKRYAQKLGVDGHRWQFAYGSKQDVYEIAEKSYLSAVVEDSTAAENYIHQGYFLLIDKNRRIRGAYDATNPDQVAQLKKELPILLKEQATK